jgi:hypothetical protein
VYSAISSEPSSSPIVTSTSHVRKAEEEVVLQLAQTNHPKFKTKQSLQLSVKISALQSNRHIENTTKEDNEFQPSINELQEGVPVVDDEQLRALPGNEEEEKEELLLPKVS